MPLSIPILVLLLATSAGGPPAPIREPLEPFEVPSISRESGRDTNIEKQTTATPETSREWSSEDTVQGVVDVVGHAEGLVRMNHADANKPAGEIASAVVEEGGGRWRRLLRPAIKFGLLGLAGLAVALGLLAGIAGSILRLFTSAPVPPVADQAPGSGTIPVESSDGN